MSFFFCYNSVKIVLQFVCFFVIQGIIDSKNAGLIAAGFCLCYDVVIQKNIIFFT